ncbi:transglutaminase family protein [Methyloligella solikamskensis]|uniref:Transglutaminase N-terminal domain-containing protein n=1 Tax=Methyloligella solikamskensis TaxID=1177756 RepID=A0ABW3J6V2_9HYPH
MRNLRITHRTRYRYDRPVEFGPHRLLIRPRDAHDMRILDSRLAVSPPAEVSWHFDTFGNSVALLSFHHAAEELFIGSELVLRRYVFDEPELQIEEHASTYPFRYDPDDSIDLSPFLFVQVAQDRPAIEHWIRTVMPVLPERTMQLLHQLSGAIHAELDYQRREEHGVQTPAQTLEAGSGTCRDYAFLFMEAVRTLGFAARFVTGYLYDAAAEGGESQLVGGGATHAWAEIFVPGAGWVEFDPTNQIVRGRDLVRVATTRTPDQALPVSGYYRGPAEAFVSMDVEVSVTRTDDEPGEERSVVQVGVA